MRKHCLPIQKRLFGNGAKSENHSHLKILRSRELWKAVTLLLAVAAHTCPLHTMSRKVKNTDMPQVNQALKGFNIEINEFGEIISSYDINKLNTFLDKSVDDKKFRGIEVVKRAEDNTVERAL